MRDRLNLTLDVSHECDYSLDMPNTTYTAEIVHRTETFARDNRRVFRAYVHAQGKPGVQYVAGNSPAFDDRSAAVEWLAREWSITA